MDESEIKSGKGGTVFSGPDAVALYRATALYAALGLYAKTGVPVNRAFTPTNMLEAAGGITGKKYKRGQFEQARADLKIWMDTMSAALPKSVESN